MVLLPKGQMVLSGIAGCDSNSYKSTNTYYLSADPRRLTLPNAFGPGYLAPRICANDEHQKHDG
jgi:hypothetical protein